ncbi:hypothetical protein [Aeromonas encheleia]
MNLSLISQKPSAATAQGVLIALQAVSGEGHCVDEVRVVQPAQWRPEPGEAAILLQEEDDVAWPEFAWALDNAPLGLPVLPLRVSRQADNLPTQGPDVRDPRFYFVSNGIVLDEAELADPACSRVLQSKLESYFPLLARLILLRQRQSAGLLS